MPGALILIAALGRLVPGLPQVACFDTAFHATIPDAAATYAVPRRWREEWGVRRYGFHGLSVEWAASQVPVPRLVVCHLGGDFLRMQYFSRGYGDTRGRLTFNGRFTGLHGCLAEFGNSLTGRFRCFIRRLLR
jgi:hypothetical protein